MKRTLAVVVLFAITAFCRADGYFTGAWFATAAPEAGMKQAGQFDIFFYDDLTFEVDVYFDGELLDTRSGSYSIIATLRGTTYKFTFIDVDGWIWTGSVNTRTRFLTGNYRSVPVGSFRGRFQASFVEIAEAGKSVTSKRKTESK